MCANPHAHHNLDLFTLRKLASKHHNFQEAKNLIIKWVKIWPKCCVREKLEFKFLNHFNSSCCCVRTTVVMMHYNSFSKQCTEFTANGGFQLLFKHSIIPCTTVHPWTWQCLRINPLKYQKSVKNIQPAEGTHF